MKASQPIDVFMHDAIDERWSVSVSVQSTDSMHDADACDLCKRFMIDRQLMITIPRNAIDWLIITTMIRRRSSAESRWSSLEIYCL